MASRGVNRVILIGNLGADPDLRYTPNGTAICAMSLATSEQWTDKSSGERHERTEWHRVVLWGKLGEVAAQYLHKGSRCYIEGSLQTRKWQAQDGGDRYTTEIKARDMQMLDAGNRSADSHTGAAQTAHDAGPREPRQAHGQFQQPDVFDDDIPF